MDRPRYKYRAAYIAERQKGIRRTDRQTKHTDERQNHKIWLRAVGEPGAGTRRQTSKWRSDIGREERKATRSISDKT
jgi:hypothetical protein